ncbi:MAG: OadG family protein [Bacteroidales bacterium]|nr:OadG family protein [Bacteroidales bacterium]
MNLLQMQLLELAHKPWVYTKGWIVTIAGFLIVIIALFILSTIFRGVAAYFKKQDAKKNEVKEIKPVTVKPTVKVAEGEIPAEVQAAIGMALYLSTNLHDEESNVITIDRRVTSWNDKNYGVRHWKR